MQKSHLLLMAIFSTHWKKNWKSKQITQERKAENYASKSNLGYSDKVTNVNNKCPRKVNMK